MEYELISKLLTKVGLLTEEEIDSFFKYEHIDSDPNKVKLLKALVKRYIKISGSGDICIHTLIGVARYLTVVLEIIEQEMSVSFDDISELSKKKKEASVQK